MSFYIKTHTVKKYETLEDIVSKYNIPDVEMLRYFHNKNAPKNSNHLGIKISAGQEIFIPEKHNIEELLEEKERLRKESKTREKDSLRNHVLLPYFLGLNTKYDVKIIHCLENEPEKKISLSFNASIKYVDTTKEGLPVLQYQKEYYRINEEELESKLYSLTGESADFLYPLEFSLDKFAVPHKIINQREIDFRWAKLKEKLSNKLTDSYSKNYAEYMNLTMQKDFLEDIKQDLFIQILFAPYTKYIDGVSSTENIFHNYGILYENNMDMEVLDDDVIKINQNAQSIDPRTSQQIFDKYQPNEDDAQEDNDDLVYSDIAGTYLLNKKNKALQSAKVKISTFLFGEEETVEIEITEIP